MDTQHKKPKQNSGPIRREPTQEEKPWLITAFPVDLRQRLRIAAAHRRIPLRTFVIETLEKEISQ